MTVLAAVIVLLSSPVAPGSQPLPEPDVHVLKGDALAVATCESGDGRGAWSATVKNPVSSASGAFQFLDGTWEWVTGLPAPASAYPMDVQEQAFWRLWDNRDGASHWAPSRHCWQRLLENR